MKDWCFKYPWMTFFICISLADSLANLIAAILGHPLVPLISIVFGGKS